MANPRKRSKVKAKRGGKSAKVQAPRLNLTNWAFLVLDGARVLARGHIVHTVGNSHLVQFGNRPGFFRMLSNEGLEEGSLFPSQADCDEFLEAYMKQYQTKEDVAEVIDKLAEGANEAADPDLGPNEIGPDEV